MYADFLRFAGWVLLAGSAAGCVYLLFGGIVTRRFAGRAPEAAVESPAASVLKPLCGQDPDLYENLASFCRQDYPQWQGVFGVQDARDPAIALVRRLIAEFPGADLALIVESGRDRGNLKVANLLNMLPAARHDIIVVADSDMRVAPDYLSSIAAPLLHANVGLVTCLYRGLPTGGLWSTLAAIHINHGFVPQAIVAEALGAQTGCFGATMALRRETLAAVGGFAAVADALADDHALGAAVRRRGLKVVLSPYIVDNIVSEASLPVLFRHELRWARTIRAVAPAGHLGSVVTQPMALALAALALGVAPAAGLAVLAASLLCRATMVRMVDRALKLSPTPLWLLPGRDLLSFVVFAASFFTRRVAWRNRTFRIGRNGRLILDGDRPA